VWTVAGPDRDTAAVTADFIELTGPPIALFVDTDHPALRNSGEYGPLVKRAVLAAMLPHGPDEALQVQTWWGSLMLPVFRPARAGSQVGMQDLNQDLFLLWSAATRLVGDGQARWTRPAAGMPWLLGNNADVYLGVLAGLPTAVADALHEGLTGHGWYLGMMIVDPADALHRRVFGLIAGWRYNRGFVADDPHRHRPQEVFAGLDVQFGPGPGRWPTRDTVIRWLPSTARMADHPQTYEEALTAAVARYIAAERPLTFGTDRRQPLVADLEGKLFGYALNPEHPVGGPKSVFFATALGIRRDDWRLLAVQLLSALTSAAPDKVRDVPPWGQEQHLRFEITVPVLGLNGRTAMVTAAWKIEDDGPAQLVSVMPGKKQQIAARDEALAGGQPAAVYDIAREVAEAARLACRSTPMAVGGGDAVEVYPQGVVGFAWVHLQDTTTALAVWLVEHEHGRIDDGEVIVSAPTFDYEPAIAWVNGFAAVLQAAGYPCTVTHVID